MKKQGTKNNHSTSSPKRPAHTGKRHKKKSPRWPFALLLICVPAFLIFLIFFLHDLLRYHAEDKANVSLAQEVRQARDGSETNSDKFAQYAALWKKNHDFAGWLFIEDTKIDYPVMHTPDDPEYYLHRAFDRSDAKSGCLFADASCSMDGNSLLIYGHHMKDKSMFGSLTDYRSQDFADEHSIICFDTLTDEREYELLAVFYWDDSYCQGETPFRYYEYTDLSSPEKFEEYIRFAKSISIYDTNVDAEYGDKILTLSTCSYHDDNGRFVVVAVSH